MLIGAPSWLRPGSMLRRPQWAGFEGAGRPGIPRSALEMAGDGAPERPEACRGTLLVAKVALALLDDPHLSKSLTGFRALAVQLEEGRRDVGRPGLVPSARQEEGELL